MLLFLFLLSRSGICISTYTNTGETVGLMALELSGALLDDRVFNSRRNHNAKCYREKSNNLVINVIFTVAFFFPIFQFSTFLFFIQRIFPFISVRVKKIVHRSFIPHAKSILSNAIHPAWMLFSHDSWMAYP